MGYYSTTLNWCHIAISESYYNYVFDQYSHPPEKINLHERKIVEMQGYLRHFLQHKCDKGKVKAGEMRIG